MYEIRFCYKNKDKCCQKDILYHLYDRYKTYEDAYREVKELKDIYKENIVFIYDFPKNKLKLNKYEYCIIIAQNKERD